MQQPSSKTPRPVLLVQSPGASRQTVTLSHFPYVIGAHTNSMGTLYIDNLGQGQLLIKKRDRLFIVEVSGTDESVTINGEFFRNAPLRSGDVLQIGPHEMTFFEDYAEMGNAAPVQWQENQSTKVTGFQDGGTGLGTVQINEIATASSLGLEPEVSHNVLSCLRQIVTADSPQTFCQLILRYLDVLAPSFARAAVFSVQQQDTLTLAATKSSSQKGTMTVSQSGMRQVMQQRKTLLLQTKVNPEAATLTRYIAPLVSGKEVLAILHVEWEGTVPLAPHFDAIGQFLRLAVSTYESLLLKDAIDNNLLNTVNVIVQAVDAKDTYTRGHSERVSKYSMAAAEILGLSKDVKKYLLISSICHDIGKIGITDAVLKKPAMLSAEEYEEIKAHPSIGGRIIERLPNAKKIISGVVYHHEKWDGTGYPDGLVGEDIPFFARIIAIADAYDAMVSGRSYSGFMQGEDAMSRFRDISELFDQDILKAFFTAFDEGRLSARTDTVVRA